MKKSITIACTLFLIIGGLMACSSSKDATPTPSSPPSPPATTQPPSPANSDEPEIYIVVDTMPEMIGGMEAFYNNLRYPEEARAEGLQGRTILQFVVDENGAVTRPAVVRSSDHKILDDAALEALEKTPFSPGVQNGRNVKVQMTLPIVFRLN